MLPVDRMTFLVPHFARTLLRTEIDKMGAANLLRSEIESVVTNSDNGLLLRHGNP